MPQDNSESPKTPFEKFVLDPDTEDEIDAAPLEELERAFKRFADEVSAPDTMGQDLDGDGGGSWRPDGEESQTHTIYIDRSNDERIRRRIHSLPETCETRFTVFSIVRWQENCPSQQMQLRFREVVLRAFRQAAQVCQNHVASGRLCELPVFKRLLFVGWACHDKQGNVALGAVLEFECAGL